MKKFYPLTFLLFFLLPSSIFAQLKLGYFRDTTTRVFSDLTGSQAEGQYVYWWGTGSGKYDLGMPVVYKLDASGNIVWSTTKDSIVGFAGRITNAYVASDAIYGIGESAIGVTFLVKVDKQTGKVLYRQDAIPVNGRDILYKEMKGTDSVRLFRSILESRFVVYSYNFSTATGAFSSTAERLSTGLDDPGVDVPIYFDTAVAFYNVHEPDNSWTIKKKDRATNSTTWTCSIDNPLTGLYQQDGYDYFFLDNNIRCVVDSSGTLAWAADIRFQYSSNDFAYNSCQVLGDTLYVAWRGIYGGYDQSSILTKFNKRTGQVYWNGAVGSSQGVGNYTGYFNGPVISVDPSGDIYLLGVVESDQQKHLQKLAGLNGKLLYDIKIPVDTFSNEQYKIPYLGSIAVTKNFFRINGKLNFLVENGITDRTKNSVHVNFVSLENPNTGEISRKFYDNDLYQFPSTTLGVQAYKDNFYTVRREGTEVYLEKYLKPQQLLWKNRLTSATLSFIPSTFAIDSLGSICVMGYRQDKPMPINYTLGSYDPINLTLMFDSTGALRHRYDDYIALQGDRRQLIGDITEGGYDGGFYLFGPSYFYHFNNWWMDSYSYTEPVHFNGNETLNNTQNIVTKSDSVFVYSNSTLFVYPSYCMAISRGNKRMSKQVLGTNNGNNGAFRSRLPPYSVYSYGASMTSDYVSKASVAKMAGPVGPTQWLYKFSSYGNVVKCVENADGNIIALARLGNDTVVVTLLNQQTGAPIWTYQKAVTSNTRAYDLAVNNENNMVFVNLLQHSSDWVEENSSYIELSASGGTFIKEVKMQGTPRTQNNILFTKNLDGIGVLMGGNLTSDSLGGQNGFTFLNTDVAPYDQPVCNLKTAFTAKADSLQTLSVAFSDTSKSGTLVRYGWNFGDGSPLDTTAKPIHIYSNAGTYNVCLEVKNNKNCTASYCDSVRVYTIVPCNVKPQFTYSSQGANLTFENHTTPGQAPYTYRWNFGDGYSDSTENPVHTYNTGGAYNICLQVTDANNCTASYCDSAMVNVLVPCTVQSHFGYTKQGTDSTAVAFANLTTQGKAPFTYTWSFGDGSVSSETNPLHIYYGAGTYHACLEVRDSTGCTSSYCEDVVISCNITANFSYEPNSSAAGEVHFTNLSSTGGLTYRWDFGDGSLTDSTVNPVHTFAQLKSYSVCLTVTETKSCQQTYCDSVVLSAAVAPLKMTATPNPVSTTLYLDFKSDVAGNATISILNPYGEQKYAQAITTVAGKNHIAVPVDNIPQGIYFVVVSGKGVNSKTKFVKL